MELPGEKTIRVVVVLVLVAIFGSTILWAVLERSGRLRWKAEAEGAKAMLTSCQNAAVRQNKAIEGLQAKMASLRKQAARALAQVKEGQGAYEREHERLQSLIKMQTADVSCDTAWSQIEAAR